jgi:hypothetical protein
MDAKIRNVQYWNKIRGVRDHDVLTISLTGMANSNISSCEHLPQIFLTLSFPTTQFPKLSLRIVPSNAFNIFSIHNSGMLSCLSESRIESARSGGEEGTRTSVKRRERNDVELCGVGVETSARRESIQRWRRFGRRACGPVRG